MEIYSKYYEFVTGERTFVKVEVSSEMFVSLRQLDFEFIDNERLEYRRDNYAVTEKFAKQSEEYAMSPEELVLYRERQERRQRRLKAIPELRKSLPRHWAILLEQIHDKGMTEVEIAKLREVSQQAISKQLRKIYAKLEKELKRI